MDAVEVGEWSWRKSGLDFENLTLCTAPVLPRHLCGRPLVLRTIFRYVSITKQKLIERS